MEHPSPPEEAGGSLQARLKLLRKTNPQKARRIQRRQKLKARQKSVKDVKGESFETTQQAVSGVSEARSQKSLLDSDASDAENLRGGERSDGDEEVEDYYAPTIEEEVAAYSQKLSESALGEVQSGLEDLKSAMERFKEMEETVGPGRGRGGDEEMLIYEDGTLGDEGYEGESDELDQRAVKLGLKKGADEGDEDEDEEEEEEDEAAKAAALSRKKARLMNRPTVAYLKQICPRPELIEVWDTTAPNPALLVSLKGVRNTIKVPEHWSYKRKFLQGKRGIEKPPFKLPHYIEATRISEIRTAIAEKDAQKTLRQKQREKVRPRHHKMNIDYQTLHDAFFKYATKPTLTKFGDVYYEGKEYETKMRQYKPGKLSDRAKEALGMATSGVTPPPWLLNMQRYGPPPSYPNLRVPGVNCPIPDGAEFGFQPGGWGKSPTAEQLDMWGVSNDVRTGRVEDNFDRVGEEAKRLWGQLQTLESSDEEDGDEMEDLTEDALKKGLATPLSGTAGTTTPYMESSSASVVSSLGLMSSGLRSAASGISSVTSGLETTETVDIRRRGFLSNSTAKPYTVLEQTKAPAQPGALFSSTTIYQLPDKATGGTVSVSGVPNLGGLATPFGLSSVGLGGTVTPLGFQGGMLTPLGPGVATPIGLGGSGGSGLTVSLNPSDMEKEGAFTADLIRQQLKHHADAASKAHKDAGLKVSGEKKKEKTQAPQQQSKPAPVPAKEADKKKKKKKEFKF